MGYHCGVAAMAVLIFSPRSPPIFFEMLFNCFFVALPTEDLAKNIHSSKRDLEFS